MAEHLSAWLPDRPIPLVVIEHPIQDVGEEELRARAAELARAVVALLDQATAMPTPNA
jgi:hypothetical protein